jgi:hypothetical protein
MLYSVLKKIIQRPHLVLLFLQMTVLCSCMPTTSRPSLDAGMNTDNTHSSSYDDPTFPLDNIFIQEGATRSETNFSLPLNFSDSFLMRGKALSLYLKSVPSLTKLCLVGKYTINNTDSFLVLSARPKTYVDIIKKTREFYLQVEPANNEANQSDCTGYNLTSALLQNGTSPTLAFNLLQLCSNCSVTTSSTGLKLYFLNGEEVPALHLSTLIISISGAASTSINSCSESTSCKARGFDCCLNGQCVKEKAPRLGVDQLPGYEAAKEDVLLNPDRYVIYPQFYFVCDNRPDLSHPSTPSTIDPDYEAYLRLMELKQLHQCLNLAKDEFSYCTLKYTQADKLIPGIFSAETSGYNDDINFSNINSNLSVGDKNNNISKIIYGGQTIYEEDSTLLPGVTFSSSNDDVTSSQSVNLDLSLTLNAKDANLYITYKVDGTCEKVNATLAKCKKTYIFGSSDTSSTKWHDFTKVFKLPSYADTSSTANLVVKVGGITVPEDIATWSKSISPNKIIFSSSYSLYQNQVIEISYYVKTNANNLIKLRSEAQEQINKICTCPRGSKCNLKPILDSVINSVLNYECSYSSTTNEEPPANQTVFISNKNMAHRYFDSNGVNYDEGYETALDQEIPTAAAANFSYINNDVLRPNNVSQYVGFTEIYGTFSKSGNYISKPSKMVKVKKDKLYDIIVSTGVFSSCVSCGSDYYSNLQKIFPQNFSGKAGGYSPDNYQSSRQNNTGLYRSDDLLFGRACFLPATMIPWSHVSKTSPQNQRRSRLDTQHFLFANGYVRDWYGFDYGSLIGSFDGVSWFSIGNLRRIKATTGKLFLAVNSYLGDLSVDNNFNVTISESTSFSSDIPDHDTESDGAECQKSHYCSNDNDCFRQVGYDYTCQNISSLTTSWPQFDANGSEIVGSNVRTLLSLVGGSNGQTKRCVYRGRGAPCLSNLDQAASGTNFNGSSLIGSLMCSHNNSCLPLNITGRFNDRVARFANTPSVQNAAQVMSSKSDLVGLGARIILRPLDYYGTKSVPASPRSVLNSNNVSSICVPGRDVNSAIDTYDLNSRHPSSRIDSSDKLFGIGPTTSSVASSKLLNACPATDSSGTSLQLYDLNITDPLLSMYSISQNLSSNLLDLSPLKNLNIYSSTNGSQIMDVGYQKNACLRAPGASCFSDLDCAPSSFIASKTKVANLVSYLNEAEIEFWKEDLVCGNPELKKISSGLLNPQFDIKKNKCCRETGKSITVFTQTNSSSFEWCDQSSSTIMVAGINKNISSSSRYSRIHSVYDKMTCKRNEISSTKAFALSLAANSATERLQQILGQFKTLDALNQRTCCTNHWVRSFSSENGGGHNFSKNKIQNIDKAMFRNISWSADNSILFPVDPDAAFECGTDQYLNASCEIKSLTADEEEKYLSWAGSLELIGIPQVAIKTDDQIFKLVDDTQMTSLGTGYPLTDSDGKEILLPSNNSNADFIDVSGKRFYSASNYTQMNMSQNSLKKVFSENEFNCCIPTGQEVTDTTSPGQCCTGLAMTSGNQRRCCLPDFTDLTVYLNRYVSSEGRGLSDTAYDSSTGYIKDPAQVEMLAIQKSMCCSGKTMSGVAISNLPIPLTGGTFKTMNSTSMTRRFNYRIDDVDNNTETGSVGSIFDAGVRWNNHVYCVPSGFGP